MSDIAIKVENLSKLYQLGEVGTGTISHDLNRWWARIRGKDDPYSKLGQTNDRTKKAESDFVWALKDINFEVKQGEVLGIIGRNGAGKSTLLKILSKITSPTTGKIYTKGRIASLLEVGTGFHPEMTGRENIYLNGAILGMRKWEIDKKFDEIVDFSGVEAYIDTPVKRYSSGMYVRLAFAVAAFLEPEILIVDEVLAVGDADFQKKCLGKMGDVSKGDGRTVLFVSHNMASVKSLCKNAIVLENGLKDFKGNANEAVKHYLGGGLKSMNSRKIGSGRDGFIIEEVNVSNENRFGEEIIERHLPIEIHFIYNNKSEHSGIYINAKFKDEEGKYFMVTSSIHISKNLKKGINTAILIIPAGFLNEGAFSMDVMVIGKDERGYHVFFSETDVLMFQVLPDQKAYGTWMGKEVGQIIPKFEWFV